MSELLDTLSNTTRLKIIKCLSQKPKNVSDIISVCGISQSAVSQHLAKLKESGIIECTKNGREQIYSVKIKSAKKLPKVIEEISIEVYNNNEISYIQYNARYLEEVHNLILKSIDLLNSKDYTQETIIIMKSWQSVERLSKKITEGYYVLALQNEVVIGIGGLVKNEICTMFVDPAFTGKGIGRTILKKLEVKARELRLEKIGLSSTLTAQKFYSACGFTIVKQTVHKLNGNDFEVFEMEKVIN